MTLIILLDYVGTAAFAVAGAYRGVKARIDILGVVIAGVLTAVGGGTLRDVFLFNEAPFWVTKTSYLLLAIIFALATFIIPRHFAKNYHPYRFLDAVGLGIFMSLGVLKGLEHGLNPLIALLAGMLPAIGGGILRGITLGETPPYVLRAGFYAAPALIGGLAFLALYYFGMDNLANIVISSTLVVVLRVYGSIKKWHLPVADDDGLLAKVKKKIGL